MNTPNLNLPGMPQNTFQPSVPFNEAQQILDALIQLVLQDTTVAAAPATLIGDLGKCWAVAPTGTGAWAGHDGEIALSTGIDLWAFITPKAGWKGWSIAGAADYRYSGTAWAAV